MIFMEEVEELMGQRVKFKSAGRIGEGVLTGMSGSGSVMIEEGGGTVFASMRDVFRDGVAIPDDKCIPEYNIAKYMERIKNLRDLVNFSLEFPITTDGEARAAYIRRAYELIGYDPREGRNNGRQKV